MNLLWTFSFDHKAADNFISPLHATGLFLYPLKASENQRFSDVFKGYRKRPVAWNGLIKSVPYPELFWAYRYMYRDRDFNESIGEPTMRQTVRHKL